MRIKNITLVLLLVVSVAYAQTNRFSVGLIGTHFHNSNSNDRISQVDNPYSYGVIVSYQISKNLTAAFSGEYFDSEIENYSGTENDLRTHISAYFTPLSYEKVRPYLSAGLVYSHSKVEYKNYSRKENNFYARYGIGVDIPLIRKISLNMDLGGYSNGLKIVGWSNSFGIRYSL